MRRDIGNEVVVAIAAVAVLAFAITFGVLLSLSSTASSTENTTATMVASNVATDVLESVTVITVPTTGIPRVDSTLENAMTEIVVKITQAHVATQSAASGTLPAAIQDITPTQEPTATETQAVLTEILVQSTVTATPERLETAADVSVSTATQIAVAVQPTASPTQIRVTRTPRPTDPVPTEAEATATETSLSRPPRTINTETPTSMATFTSTPTQSPTDTATHTNTPTNTALPTATLTDTATHTNTPTSTSTDTVTAVPTFTETATPTNTPTPTATFTNTPTSTPTNTALPTATLTDTAMPTNTPMPTDTETSTPTNTDTPTSTATLTYTPTSTPTDTETSTPTNTDTPTATATHIATPTATQTNSATTTFTPPPTDLAFLPTPTPPLPASATPAMRGACVQPDGWAIYTVQPGNTLFSIGRNVGSSVTELTQVNCIGDADLITTGDRLFVPHLPNSPVLTGTPGSSGSSVTETTGGSTELVPLGCVHPSAQITSPKPSQTVRGEFTVVGSATLDNFWYYRIEVRAHMATVYNVLGLFYKPVVNDALASVDTEAFGPGLFWIRVSVVDKTGGIPAVATCAIPVIFE
jgi:hypothetical protein